MLGEGLGVKETPQQKYQRLLHEVQELTTEVEKIKVTSIPWLLSAWAVRFPELGNTNLYLTLLNSVLF